MEEEDAGEEEEEEEEIKAEENLRQATNKNKKDKENSLTNPRFDVITVKNLVILQMNAKTRKKPRVHEESVNVTTEESNLFMAYIEDILLQGVQEMNLQENVWYLDTRANSHMTTKRSYFYSIDKNQHGLIRFGNESSVRFEGK